MTHPDGLPAVPTVGVVGAGWVAARHLRALDQLGVTTVVLARSERGARHIAASGMTARLADSLDALLQQCDIIDICTPTDSHVEFAHAAIDAGRHVICEKPLAPDARTAAELVERASSAGVRLLPAHVVRYVPAYRALYETVRAGGLGAIVSARFTRTTAAPLWSDWFWDESRSGGIIVDQMIHDLDQAVRLAGAVARVHARHVPPTPTRRTASATVILTHESGALSQVIGLWGQPGTVFRTTFRVAGTGGTVEHDSVRSSPLRVRAADDDSLAEVLGDIGDGQGSPFVDELRDLLDAIRTGRPAKTSPTDGVIAVGLAEAARRSALTGEPDDLSSILGPAGLETGGAR